MPFVDKEIYTFGYFLLDPAERVLSCEGTHVRHRQGVRHSSLSGAQPGRMLTKDELLKQVWPDTFVEEVNLAVNISAIRKALGENPQDHRYIATVPGHGYRLIAEVSSLLSLSQVLQSLQTLRR